MTSQVELEGGVPPRKRVTLPLVDGGRAPSPATSVDRLSPKSVRLSVTDRCDYACTYCRPGHREDYADERMSIDAWSTIVDA
ncbi:MAG TPA: GTP 3',8-cyclase MoaA, partial [Polyangiaceae bacterium]|nr:GTP 3',8-cyclase MoaA [Polyangiaceae bacterium]